MKHLHLRFTLEMATYHEEEDPFEEDIVFDQAGLLNTSKMNSAIRRVSSGKCVLFAKTLGLCGAFFGLGLCLAIPGPTLSSPVMERETSISPISNIYMARTSGYLIGSIIGGMLFDRFNRLFLLFVSLLLMSVFITVSPWCQVFWLLQACMVGLGVAMGFLDTGGNVLCLDLWGRNSGPFMQALHFSYGLGAFVAPLLAAPFLEPSPLNSTYSDMSSAITEYPVHIWPLKGNAFQLNALNRTKRIVDNFSNAFQDISEDSLVPLSYTANPFESSPDRIDSSSILATTNTVSNDILINKHLITSTNVPNTAVHQRIPKRKPSKIDGSKLGSKDWDKVHVGKPPPADLLPPTSTTPIPSTSLPSSSPFSSSFSSSSSSSSSPSLTNTTTPLSSINPALSPVFFNNSTNINKVKNSNIMENGKYSNEIKIVSFLKSQSEGTSESVIHTDKSVTLNTIEMDHISRTNPSSTVPKETREWNSTLASAHKITPPFSSYSQLKENSLQLSYFKGSSNQNSSVNVGHDHSKTEALQQFVQTTHVTKGSTLSEKEDKLYTSNEIVTSFSNVVLPFPSLTEPTVSLMNITALGTSGNLLVDSVVPPISKQVHRKPGTFDNDTEHINTIFNIFASRIEKYGFNKIQFSYLILGIFVFSISLVFLGFLCHNPRDPKSKQEEGQGGKKITNKLLHQSLISLMAFFFFLYVGLELTYGQLVLAFAVHSDLHLPQSTGSVISIVFWGSFAAMRFASIFFASGFSPTTMLVLNFLFCTCGSIVVSVLASYIQSALWVGTALIGIGLASMFPTGILWIERYIHVTNKVAAIFVIGASLGEMICPMATYHLMFNDPTMLMHSTLVFNVMCIAIFAVSWWLASRQGEKYSLVSNNGYQLANQHDEEEDMMDMSPSGAPGRAAVLRRHSFSSEHRALLNGNLHHGP